MLRRDNVFRQQYQEHRQLHLQSHAPMGSIFQMETVSHATRPVYPALARLQVNVSLVNPVLPIYCLVSVSVFKLMEQVAVRHLP